MRSVRPRKEANLALQTLVFASFLAVTALSAQVASPSQQAIRRDADTTSASSLDTRVYLDHHGKIMRRDPHSGHGAAASGNAALVQDSSLVQGLAPPTSSASASDALLRREPNMLPVADGVLAQGRLAVEALANQQHEDLAADKTSLLVARTGPTPAPQADPVTATQGSTASGDPAPLDAVSPDESEPPPQGGPDLPPTPLPSPPTTTTTTKTTSSVSLKVTNTSTLAATTSTAPLLQGNQKPHPAFWATLVALICFTGMGFNSIYTQSRSRRQAADGGDASDDERLTCDDLDEDCYGMAIASMVKDTKHMMKETGSQHMGLRLARLIVSLKLLFFNILLQGFLIVCILNFSVAKAVFDIRGAYDVFERKMYDGHIALTSHGNARGLDDKYFVADNFNKLTDDEKADACRVPFAQPMFLYAVLLVWSLMVVGEMKSSGTLFDRLVMRTERADSMARSTVDQEDGEVIVKLTLEIKALITVLIIIPRLLIAVILLWLGCRWLAATNDFQDLMLNSVGLEFVLLLKDLLYNTLVPARNKRDTRRMKINVEHESGTPTPMSFLGTFLWIFLCFIWVYMYIFVWQAVLPGYRWDVHGVCVQWYQDNYAGWG